MAQCCYWCLVAILVKKCLWKTTVCTSSANTCLCVILTHVDRMNTVFLTTKPSWRQAVRLKPTGAYCRCCQPSASTPKAKEIGCLLASALEGKQNIYEGNHSNRIFDYKATLPQGVRPLGSVWVYNLLSVLPVDRLNYLSNMAELKARYPDVSIAQPSVCIATVTRWCRKTTNSCATRTVEEREIHQGLYMTTPVLTSAINMLLLWGIELASR